MHGASSDKTRPEVVLRRFAANLLMARKKAGLTQAELAERCAMHRTEISLLERAGRLPRVDTLAELAAALGVPAVELCDGIDWDVERQRFR